MTLSAVSNRTWLNVEVTLNSSNRVECCIARRRDGGAWVDTTQRELDWHKKTIGMYEGLVRKLRAEPEGRLIESEPRPFDYGIPAELFMGKRKGGPRQPLKYRRFATAAEAIRFAVEELPAVRALGAWMQVGDERFDGDDIQRLYESDDFPLQRRPSD